MKKLELHNDCKVLSQRLYPRNRQLDSNGCTFKRTISNHKNGFYSEVYTKGNKAILAIRGTETESGAKELVKDGLNDTQMGLGYLPFQMRDAELAYIQTIRQYGKENVILTGHSLGGSEAQILGAKYGLKQSRSRLMESKILAG